VFTPLGKARALALAGCVLLVGLAFQVGDPMTAAQQKPAPKKGASNQPPPKPAPQKKGVPNKGGVQPIHFQHIREALAHLKVARKHLEHAQHHFGGHRVAALRDTTNAIRQAEQALASKGR
jgi:hypothetical protein